MLTAGCEARAAGKGLGALRCAELPAWPAVQVVPAIHAHFGNAYSTWQTAATLLHSPHDAVAARYLGSVKMWLRYKPTLVALANAPLTARHWHELWRCMGMPYVNGFTLGEAPHVQYYNRHFGYVLRPARSQVTHDPYAPGLHHLCFRVESVADVFAAATRLGAAGIETSGPALHGEFAPDDWAIFFRDPDGLRLEITNYRQERRERHDRWEEGGA